MEALRIIGDDHRNLWRVITTIDLVADELEAGGAVDAAFFAAVFDYFGQFMEGCHHRRENEHLFPFLRQHSAAAALVLDRLQALRGRSPEMLDALRGILAAAATAPDKAFVAALREYSAAVKTYIRIEENEAFPLARGGIPAAAWTAIDRAFLDRDAPLFGNPAEARHRELFHRIASLAPESVGLGGHSTGALQLGPVPAKADVLLAVSGVESSYGRIKALKGVSLEVRRGETVALIGANGAGKSTFLRTVSGVQAMSAGSIRFDGEDISTLPSAARVRRGICQSPEGRQVFGPLSTDDNLRLGAYTQPKGQVAGDLDRVFALFPILKEKRAQAAGTLSGGQQQMLAIGRALMGRPRLLLLDEPSMGLAPLLVEEMFNVIKTLKAQGTTILLVEQNAYAALEIADRGYVLETGSVALSGTGEELLGNEQVRAAYLGM